MKKIFAALFASAMAFGMGCSMQTTDSKPTEEPSVEEPSVEEPNVEESEEVGSSADAWTWGQFPRCPNGWQCAGMLYYQYYSTKEECQKWCGPTKKCFYKPICTSACYCE